MKSGGAVLVGATLVAGVAMASSLGCSKPKSDSQGAPIVKTLGEKVPVRGPGAPVATTTAEGTEDDTPKERSGAHAIIGDNNDASPLVYQVKIVVDSAAPKEDPDLAVVERARESASGCFTNISSGPDSRTATITVHVLPTGSVSRTEVSADSTQEPWILSCLDGVGEGLRFSEKPKADIRVFTIGVSVSRSH